MPKIYLNQEYTDQHFEIEKNMYFKSTDPLRQLSLNFVIRFYERIPDDKDVYKHSRYRSIADDVTGDGDDYLAWGYALHGYWIEDENGGGEVFIWADHYQRMMNGKDFSDFKTIDELMKFLAEKLF